MLHVTVITGAPFVVREDAAAVCGRPLRMAHVPRVGEIVTVPDHGGAVSYRVALVQHAPEGGSIDDVTLYAHVVDLDALLADAEPKA